MYRCESWTVKKAERWRIDAFELWCWRRLLKVPWTARRSNQSILKEISPGCSLEGLMLTLKLQYFGHLMWRVNSLEGLGAGGEGDNRGWDGWMTSPTQWTWFWVNSGSWWWTRRPGVLWFMESQRVGCDWALNWSYIHVWTSPDNFSQWLASITTGLRNLKVLLIGLGVKNLKIAEELSIIWALYLNWIISSLSEALLLLYWD